MENQRRNELARDKRFKSMLERVACPQMEVQLYLQRGEGGRRNPYLSFHALDDFVLKQARSIVIFTKAQGIIPAWRPRLPPH